MNKNKHTNKNKYLNKFAYCVYCITKVLQVDNKLSLFCF